MSEVIDKEKWKKDTQELIEKIKSMKSDERLELIALLEECNEAVNASTIGWSAYLKRPKVMKHFETPELKILLDFFKDMATKFLEEDIKAASKILAIESETKKTEDKSKEKEKESKKLSYRV